jgi:Tol biopolymer transport system component
MGEQKAASRSKREQKGRIANMESHLGSRLRWCIAAATAVALSLEVGGFASTHNARASAPDNSTASGILAFSKDGDIWTMRPDGSSLTRLTTDPAVDRAPSWSPDGTKIAFASKRTGNFEIWVTDADGANQHEVTHDGPTHNDRSPSWTADGSQIVYDVDFNDIYIINADGTGEQHLRTNAAFPNVSPRNVIAFTDQVDFGAYTMELAGTGLQFISNPLGQGTLDPDWSPSGDRLAFVCDVIAIPTNNLCASQADGTSLLPLDTSLDRVDFSPTWSPNGKKIAFVGCLNFFTIPNCDIYTVKHDGTHLKQLTTFGVGPGTRGVDWGPNSGS